MSYVTATDIRNALAPAGSTDSSTAASMDDASINREITNAQDEIDSALRSRYATPFDTPPNIVKTITTDIAAYLATLTFRRGDPLDIDDPIRLRYARARDILIRLIKGEMELGDDQPSPTAEAAVVNPLYDGNLFQLEDFDLATQGAPGFDYYRYRSRG